MGQIGSGIWVRASFQNKTPGGFYSTCNILYTTSSLRGSIVEVMNFKYVVCYSFVNYYNGEQRFEQFLQVGRLCQALILLG